MVNQDDQALDWKQNYPGYTYKSEGSLEREWDLSCDALKSDEKISNTLFVVSTAIVSMINAFALTRSNASTVLLYDNAEVFLFLDLFFILLFSIFLTDASKSIVWAKRKLIILRRMLGISWGHQKLVLPTYRLEGAYHPFVIRMFGGWLSSTTLPFAFVSLINAFLAFNLCGIISEKYLVTQNSSSIWQIVATSVVIGYSCLFYRLCLLDEHETLPLLVLQLISRVFRFPLSENFEYTIYKAKLAIHEAKRLGINLQAGRKYAILIEDRRFLQHPGVDYRGIARSIVIRIPFIGALIAKRRGINPRSGGSTITQQIVRTLFFLDYKKRKRRKIFEFLLARFWIESVFKKDEILDLYLVAVTYARSKPGLIAGLSHYGLNVGALSDAQWFFMVERIANSINQKYNPARIAKLVEFLGSDKEVKAITRLYSEAAGINFKAYSNVANKPRASGKPKRDNVSHN